MESINDFRDKSNDFDSSPKFLEEMTTLEISQWLIEGFESSHFKEPVFHERLSLTVQLKYLFRKLNKITQKNFRQAIGLAIEEIDYIDNDSTSIILKNLAILSAYTYATSAISPLISIIDRCWYTQEIRQPHIDTVEKVLATLSGFIASSSQATEEQKLSIQLAENIENLFKKIFFKDFDRRFLAQIFIGLCLYNPSKYTDYLAHFFDSQSLNPNYYDLDLVMTTFRHVVTPTVIIEGHSKTRF